MVFLKIPFLIYINHRCSTQTRSLKSRLYILQQYWKIIRKIHRYVNLSEAQAKPVIVSNMKLLEVALLFLAVHYVILVEGKLKMSDISEFIR